MTPLPLGILALSGAVAAGAYDLLETQVLSSSAASVTFTGLGSYSDYKHLQIRAVLAQSDNTHDFRIRVNGDATAGKYRSHYLFANGSSVSSDNTNVTYFEIKQAIPRLATVVTSYNAAITDILDFSNTSKNTTVRTLAGFHQDSSLGQGISLNSGGWFDTTAITSITYEPSGGNFISGCRLSLYGVK